MTRPRCSCSSRRCAPSSRRFPAHCSKPFVRCRTPQPLPSDAFQPSEGNPMRYLALAFTAAVTFVLLGCYPVKSQERPASWTGAYVGAHVGGAWGDVTTKDDAKDGVPSGPFGYTAS